jgi:tetratricopeptide (TPR) repeat protein
LGNLYEQTNRFELALEYHQRALEIKKNLFGEVHPTIATSIHNIAGIYLKTMDLEKAEKYSKEASNNNCNIHIKFYDIHNHIKIYTFNISIFTEYFLMY